MLSRQTICFTVATFLLAYFMPLDMNGILDAVGLHYAPNGQFMIHVALVSPICGRNADVHWRVGLSTLIGEWGFRHTLTSRRVAAPALPHTRYLEQLGPVLPAELVRYIDISVAALN